MVCRTVWLVNGVNGSDREMIEVTESGMQTRGNNEKKPFQNERENGRPKRVVAWGGREYEADEFRSMLLKEPVDASEEGRDDAR